MASPRGMARWAFAAAAVVLLLTSWVEPGQASGWGWGNGAILALSAQTPMEAQMLSGPSTSYPPAFGSGSFRGETMWRLPQNFRITFLYQQDTPPGGAERLGQPPLLFRYSVDYYFTPNLRVGLSGFLFHPPGDQLSFLRQRRDLLMGWGPSLKYDLGRWSFAFQGQLEKGQDHRRLEEDKNVQSWFRVWYAF